MITIRKRDEESNTLSNLKIWRILSTIKAIAGSGNGVEEIDAHVSLVPWFTNLFVTLGSCKSTDITYIQTRHVSVQHIMYLFCVPTQCLWIGSSHLPLYMNN